MIAKIKKQKKGVSREDLIFQIFFVVFVFLLVGILVYSNYKMNKKRTEMTNQIESLQSQINTLEQKKSQLESNISDTQDPAYWEDKIRNQGYVKEGENQVVVLDSGNQNDQTNTSQSSTSSQGIWQEIQSAISGIFRK